MHPLVRELVALLPSDGEVFPEPARKRWVVAIEAAFELIYHEGDDRQPPARPRHRALPATASESDPAEARLAEYGVRYSADYSPDYGDDYATGPVDYPAVPAADYRADYPDPPNARPYAADQHGGDPYGSHQYGADRYGGDQYRDQHGDRADYPAEHRTDPPATDAYQAADNGAEAPRRRGDQGVGSTYSSYTWDTSPS